MAERQRITYAFSGLDLHTPDHCAPGGLTRVLENLYPDGSADCPVLRPVEASEGLGTVSGVLACGSHVRSKHGPLSNLAGDPNQGLNRLVAVKADGVYIIDPEQDYAEKKVYTFGKRDATRRAQFVQQGERLFIAVTHGPGIGSPEITLVLQDDVCSEFRLPSLPRLEASVEPSASGRGLRGGVVYGCRYAYLLHDGTMGPMSHPVALQLGGDSTARWSLQLTVDAYEQGADRASSPPYQAWIKGIAILLTVGIEPDESETSTLRDVADAPLYHVGTLMSTDEEDTFVFSGEDAGIAASPFVADGNLLRHAPRAGAVFSYNGRLMLGDVAYDFERPNAPQLLTRSRTAGTSDDYSVRVGVTITTQGGTYQRISAPVYIASGEASAVRGRGIRAFGQGWGGAVLYPHRQATQLSIYVKAPGEEVYRTVVSVPAGEAAGSCTPFDIGVLDLTQDAAAKPLMPDAAAANAQCERQVNRLLFSEPFRPFDLPAAHTTRVHASPSDVIVGLAATTQPVSEGQFGQYPVLVLGTESIYALKIGQEPFVEGMAPLSLNGGCVGRHAFANVGGAIAAATDAGVFMITSGLDAEPISMPLHDNQRATLRELDADTVLACFTSPRRGRRELWVGSASVVRAYSLSHQQWFTLTRKRTAFVRARGELIGIDRSGMLWKEAASGTTPVAVRLRTGPLHLEAPAYDKRVHALWIRQRAMLDDLTWTLSARDPGLHNAATAEALAVAELSNGICDPAALPNVRIASGALKPGDFDTVRLPFGLGETWFMDLRGTGMPDQALEGVGFEYEVRRRHRMPAFIPDLAQPAFLAFTIDVTAPQTSFNIYSMEGGSGTTWSWGDGTSDVQEGDTPPEHVYAEPGRYQVRAVSTSLFAGVTSLRLQKAGSVNSAVRWVSDVSEIGLSLLTDARVISLYQCEQMRGRLALGTLPESGQLIEVDLSACDRVEGELDSLPDSVRVFEGRSAALGGTTQGIPRQAVYINNQFAGPLTGDTADLPDSLAVLLATSCEGVTGTTLPPLLQEVQLPGSGLQINLRDLPRSLRFIALDRCSQLTGSLNDLPPDVEHVNLNQCSQLDPGTIEDFTAFPQLHTAYLGIPNLNRALLIDRAWQAIGQPGSPVDKLILNLYRQNQPLDTSQPAVSDSAFTIQDQLTDLAAAGCTVIL